jgi:hypothetical protein
LPTVPDCVKGAEPDVVHCHRCNQPCPNAVVFLHKTYFLKTKKAEKAQKQKQLFKKLFLIFQLTCFSFFGGATFVLTDTAAATTQTS